MRTDNHRSTGLAFLRELEDDRSKKSDHSRATTPANLVDRSSAAAPENASRVLPHRQGTDASAEPLFVPDDEGHDENVDPEEAETQRMMDIINRRQSQMAGNTDRKSGASRVASSARQNIAAPNQARSPVSRENSGRSRFVDRQDGAHKVAFDSQSQVPAFRLPGVPASSTLGKRTRQENDDDDEQLSQDVGFETDDRAHPAPNRQPLAPLRRPEPEAEVQATSSALILPRTSNMNTNADSARSSRPRKNPGQAIDPVPLPAADGINSPEPTQLDRLRQVSQQNKANRPAARVQTRTPWSDDETNRLLNLIESHGTSYAMLKKIDEQTGNVLHLREAEALRFKARNMKVEFLK